VGVGRLHFGSKVSTQKSVLLGSPSTPVPNNGILLTALQEYSIKCVYQGERKKQLCHEDSWLHLQSGGIDKSLQDTKNFKIFMERLQPDLIIIRTICLFSKWWRLNICKCFLNDVIHILYSCLVNSCNYHDRGIFGSGIKVKHYHKELFVFRLDWVANAIWSCWCKYYIIFLS
jgi:hypothetical protein